MDIAVKEYHLGRTQLLRNELHVMQCARSFITPMHGELTSSGYYITITASLSSGTHSTLPCCSWVQSPIHSRATCSIFAQSLRSSVASNGCL